MTLESVERANVLRLKSTHSHNYSLVGLFVSVSVCSICNGVYVCITMTNTPSLTPSWLETINHSAQVAGQTQAIQTFRPNIREASITTAWLTSDWIQLCKLTVNSHINQIKIAFLHFFFSYQKHWMPADLNRLVNNIRVR